MTTDTTTTSIEKIKKALERLDKQFANCFNDAELTEDAKQRYAVEVSKIKNMKFLVIDEESETSITYHQEFPVFEF